MVRSLLLIQDPEKAHNPPASALRPSKTNLQAPIIREDSLPGNKLAAIGYRLILATTDKESRKWIRDIDVVLLDVPSSRLTAWQQKIHSWRSIPVVWWCDGSESSIRPDEFTATLDGMLCPEMTSAEMRWSLLLSVNHHLRREQMRNELQQLSSRMEERKWIDQAKGILCEIKQINQTEAYEFLRKQAMNERKKMTDVAASIVKVYQLLREQDKGGGKR